jgi:hypothetical protein
VKFVLLVKICLATSLLFGCASTLSVRSEPSGADVSLREMGSTEDRVIGQTPLNLSLRDIKLSEKTKPFVLKVHHSEFGDKTALISRLDGQDIELFLTLDSIDSSNKSETSATLNVFIDDLFRAQTMAKTHDFSGATSLLNKLIESHPRVAAAYELRGSLAILKNDITSALRDYNVAVQLNPESLEAARVQRQLQDLFKHGGSIDRGVSNVRSSK